MTASNIHIPSDWTPVGYAALVRRYELRALPNHHQSYVAPSAQRRTISEPGLEIDVYPRQYAIPDTLGEQLKFAIRYDGINLEILAALFEKADPVELEGFIKAKPTGKQQRRLWFLYEFLTEKRLDLEDLKHLTRYERLLDEPDYFTTAARPSPRHKIINNLLGNRNFCPMIRRTGRLKELIGTRLDQRSTEVLRRFPEEVLRRALNYLFTKETKSSFEIERITPARPKLERFVELLKMAGTSRFLNKPSLLSLQQATVDERFINRNYRSDQNYVGATVHYGREDVFYVAPRPEDVASLMEGLLECAQRMLDAHVHPVLIAGVIAFGFVFIHPFDDGNGRLHRFLIHHILAKTGFTPPGLIFPVSATMLRQRAKYEAMLELFSKPLLELVIYELNEKGEMTAFGNDARHYRYLDMTRIVEILFEFIQETIETELPSEVQFLVNYDQARQGMQEIVDMPDRKVDLFIRLCLQNHGRLSRAKRESEFSMLTDEEVLRLEACFREAFQVQEDRAS